MPKIIFAINAYRDFAKKLTLKNKKIILGQVEIKKFSDGEIYARLLDDVKGKEVFILGTTAPPSDNLLELLLLVNAAKENQAKKVCAVLPCFGYERADRLVKKGEAISARMMAEIVRVSGVSQIIAVDLHSFRVVDYLKKKIKLTHLSAINVLATAIKKMNLNKLVVVAPDNGALVNAKRIAKFLRCPVAWMEKFRPEHNVACIRALRGAPVKNRTVILSDDMIDTAGTICAAARFLKEAGAAKILVTATHGILSGPAIERLRQAPVEKIIITDTVPLSKEKMIDKMRVVSLAEMMAKNL